VTDLRVSYDIQWICVHADDVPAFGPAPSGEVTKIADVDVGGDFTL
jgi:hypothetical protein